MTVVLIHEDNHGLIGVAKDYDSAIDCLLQNQWLNEYLEVYDVEEHTFKSLKELGYSIEDIRKWDRITFNSFFVGIFYLDVDNVWGM